VCTGTDQCQCGSRYIEGYCEITCAYDRCGIYNGDGSTCGEGGVLIPLFSLLHDESREDRVLPRSYRTVHIQYTTASNKIRTMNTITLLLTVCEFKNILPWSIISPQSLPVPMGQNNQILNLKFC
jgi:hypothetical protein